jgi:hypothetical protein
MELKIKGRKGYSISGWTEGIILLLVVITMSVYIIAGMNGLYGKSSNPVLEGLGGITDDTEQDFINYQSTANNELSSGEATFDATSGLTLTSSWGLLKTIGTAIWNFITGNWIKVVVIEWIGLPSFFALMFQALYFISIVLILLYLLFKVEV